MSEVSTSAMTEKASPHEFQDFTHPQHESYPTGILMAGSDAGFNYKPENEDGYIVTPDGCAVIDGMGGYDNGSVARNCAVTALEAGILTNKPFEDIQNAMHQLMKDAGLVLDGVTYIAFRIVHGTELEYGKAGDSDLMVIRDGSVVHQTEPENWSLSDLHEALNDGRMTREDLNKDLEGKPDTPKNRRKVAAMYVTNVVRGEAPGNTTTDKFDLLPDDLIIAFTDGIGDNFSPEELALMVKNRPIEEGFRIIEVATRLKMTLGLPEDIAQQISGMPTDEAIILMHQLSELGDYPIGKPDNRTLLIYEFKDNAP